MSQAQRFTPRLILASGSPRRSELMEEAGYVFEVRPADADEALQAGIDPTAAARDLACRKADAVAAGISGEAVVIGADTVVALDGQIFGKPADVDAARVMLETLSGSTHEVITGVCICAISGGERTDDVFSETTAITFRTLTDAEIEDYLATGEWADKAGGYGIQAEGGGFVESIDGDFDNVVGLPITAVKEHLQPYLA